MNQAQHSDLTVTPQMGLNTVAATELRPWGSFTILEEGRGHKIKRIEVKPGHRLSLQMHYHRSEHWIVVSGTSLVMGNRRFCTAINRLMYPPAPSTV
jgi:mannose-6-phosphate isomerase